MGLKPSDYRALPLCPVCHGRQHGMGERTFWDRLGLVPECIMAQYLVAYSGNQPGMVKLLEAAIIAEREAAS